MIRVRVRGIYATALAVSLLENGFELSDLSAKLRSRLRYEGSPEPPHVTVKQSDREADEIVIIGFPEEADAVIAALRETFPYSVHHIARPNLHSAYKVVVDESCKTVVEGVEARVVAKECYEGKELVAEVVKSRVFPRDEVVLEEGFRVIGFYAELIVGRGPGVTFSKHITNPSVKSLLISLASDITLKGFKVHWRSSARSAPVEALRSELERLLDEAMKISVMAREAPPGTQLYPGERLDVVDVVFEDKRIMDAIRGEVVPTMPYHHSLKSGGEKMSSATELGDKISAFSTIPPESVYEYLYEVARDSKSLAILHKKISGERIVLGRATVRDVLQGYIVVSRKVKEYGKYDGIGEVKEPGDVILSFIRPFEKHLIHAYFDPYGLLKGIYVNVNTGIEIGEGNVRYLDLEVDVIIKGEIVKAIDVEELNSLPAPLAELASKEVERLLKESNRIVGLVERGAELLQR
ncbi:MAG: DUF402 domain-containing protein [Crenarchaeota archaeon]|nr:DUF402 domain-containing protein [Thermoproteota archaeon]